MTCWHGKKTINNGWFLNFLMTSVAAVSCPPPANDFFVCLCQFFCSVTSVFFFQQARKSLFCDCYMEDHIFSLCEVIEDIVEEMKVKDRGERRK